MNYYSRKDKLKAQAEKHNEEMIEKYGDEIKDAKVRLYNVFDSRTASENQNAKKPNITLEINDTVSEAFNHENACILDFASYRNPGGRFLDGSNAQEEALCHASYLYNVLSNQIKFYSYNNEHKNKGLYGNRLLYCKDIRFFKGKDTKQYDVIVCAAPNWSVAKKYNNFTIEENDKALKERMQLIKLAAEDNNVKTLILGAFGCGVFAQDPNTVSNLFLDVFSTSTIENVVFALLKDINYEAFKKNFEKRGLI